MFLSNMPNYAEYNGIEIAYFTHQFTMLIRGILSIVLSCGLVLYSLIKAH